MSFKQNNPLSRKTSPINKNWIKGAIKRPGAFKKKAEEAGMSTKAFADKVIANKEDYDSRTDKQAELAKTLMGMSRHESGHVNPEQGDFDYEDPNYKETKEYKKFQRKQKKQERKNKKDRSKDVDDKGRKRGEAGFQQDEQEAYYEGSPAKLKIQNPEQVAETLEKAAMGKRTAKSRGKVDASGREGSNRQERKKRRQERRSIRKDKTLSASQKKMAVKESRQQQKDNVRGDKKEGVSRKKCKYKK